MTKQKNPYIKQFENAGVAEDHSERSVFDGNHEHQRVHDRHHGEHKGGHTGSVEHLPATDQHRGEKVKGAGHEHDHRSPLSGANKVSGRGGSEAMTGSDHRPAKPAEPLLRGGLPFDPTKPQFK
jgi:hypothetical protein